MDGIGADADVTFVLTTNRPEALEVALRDRPGRADLEPVIAETEGVTASFVKELLRRAVLHEVRAGAEGDPLPVGDKALAAALRDLQDSRNSLTRSLLGS